MSLVGKGVIPPTNLAASVKTELAGFNSFCQFSVLLCPRGVKENFELITAVGDELKRYESLKNKMLGLSLYKACSCW